MNFVRWILSSATVFSSWVTACASLAALVCMLWSGAWRRQIHLTAFVALGGWIMVFMLWPCLWTVRMACEFERLQIVLSCLMAIEVARRALGSWRFLWRTAFVVAVCAVWGATLNYLPHGEQSCMRVQVAWCLVALGVLTEARMEIQAKRLRIDRLSEVSTKAFAWMWALQAAYRGLKELSAMNGDIFGWLQVGVYLWAMALVCTTALSVRSEA